MSIKAIRWAYSLFEVIDIPPQERAVLVVLCYHHHDKTGECYPSYDTIALLSGYRRRRVIEAVKNLKEWGLIRTQKRRVKGHQGSNQFLLFGAMKRGTRVQTGAPSQSAQKSTLARVQTGAPDRGNIYTSDFEGADVVDFPIQKIGNGGGYV